MKEILRVLIIDDEDAIRTLIDGRLTRRGFATSQAADAQQALKLVPEFQPHVAITDLRMPGMDGFELLAQLEVPTIIITGHGDKESAIRAVELGAFGFFEKPFDLDALEIMVRRAGEKRLVDLEKEMLLKRLDRLCRLQGREIESLERTVENDVGGFTGSSAALREVRSILARLAQKPAAGLLVLGETGTGKEVVARELHRLTHPKDAEGGRTPFLALNCSAIPADLLESELFGHEKGAFSGAQNTRIGLAEAVRAGTLFLDEIGELDPRHQAKILRLLQEKRFKRVGANQELTFQGRIIAATHRDLPAMSKDGRFREDLYYRLSVVTVTLPPLRERREDIDALAKTLCARHGMKGLAPAALESARAYAWPGNIRELNNWIERASILGLHDANDLVTATLGSNGGSDSFAPASLPSQGAMIVDLGPSNVADLKSLRARILDEYDRRWIEQALDSHAGNISAAAKTLGIDRKNLTRRIKELGISPDSKKAA